MTFCRRLARIACLVLLTLTPARAQPMEFAVGIYRIHLSFAPALTVGHPDITAEIDLADKAGPATELQVQLQPAMADTSCSNVQPLFLQERSPGRYVGSLNFRMGGAWKLNMTVRGKPGEARLDVPVTVEQVGDSAVAQVSLPSDEPALAPTAETVSQSQLAFSVSPSELPTGPNQLILEGKSESVWPEGIEVWAGLSMPGTSVMLRPRPGVPTTPGRYRLPVRFPLAGTWNITVEARQGPRILALQNVTVRVVAPFEWSRRWPTLLLATLTGSLVIWAWRSRQPRRLGGLAIVLAACLVGEWNRRHWPPDDSMGATMNMASGDLGLTHAEVGSPQPVLLEKARNESLVATARLAGVAQPCRQWTLTASPGGRLTWKADLGQAVQAGQVLALVGDKPIRTPFAGMLAERTGIPMVEAGSAIGTVSDTDHMEIVAQVDRLLSLSLRRGEEVHVSAAFPMREAQFTGTLESISPVVVADSQTVEARILVPNQRADQRLLPGQEVTVTLPTGRSGPVVSVSSQALTSYSDVTSVWVAQPLAGAWLARRREIGVGLEGHERVQVTRGLRPGEQVVVAGGEWLTEGALIIPGRYGLQPYQNLLLPRGIAP